MMHTVPMRLIGRDERMNIDGRIDTCEFVTAFKGRRVIIRVIEGWEGADDALGAGALNGWDIGLSDDNVFHDAPLWLSVDDVPPTSKIARHAIMTAARNRKNPIRCRITTTA